MPASRLPPELLLEIARKLFAIADTSSLKTLSLVSSEWLSVARPFIFRDLRVQLGGMKSLDALTAIVRPSPALSSLISTLCLVGDINGRESSDPQTRYLYPFVSPLDILALVAMIPRISSISVQLCRVEGGMIESNLRRFQGVYNCSLFLFQVSIDDIALDMLTGSFRGEALSLTKLHFLSPNNQPLNFLSSGNHTSDGSSIFSSLRHLCVGLSTNFRGRIPIILAIKSKSLPELQMLELACDLAHNRHLHTMNGFLNDKGRPVEVLLLDYTITMGWGDYISDYLVDEVNPPSYDGFGLIPESWGTVSLKECCPSLRSITFFLSVLMESESYGATEKSPAVLQWNYALRLIASAPLTLSSIKIGIYLDEDTSAEDMMGCTISVVEWENWDNVLRQLLGLREVVFFRVDQAKRRRELHLGMEGLGHIPEKFARDMSEWIKERMAVERVVLLRYVVED
ncbi:hypothetical protein BXZ70DRAFT_907505 [Cristinia sonorae]|uniref:F-box domain-containing protein n=1 Tax=Cristinia sonorae TaxID=1940300 RepID=A0A8K0XPU6_9AGAR|nr:hypothetical protein BXZ70DRAFT_907505 [Cristinia sonorae]